MALTADGTSSYDYALPPEKIAQSPLIERDGARLLVDLAESRPNMVKKDMLISDLPNLLGKSDLLVVNNTRVLNARLNLHRKTGGKTEVLTLEPIKGTSQWTALIKPGRKIKAGSLLYFQGNPVIEVLEADENTENEGMHPGAGERLIGPAGKYSSILEVVEDLGEIPLPPYIKEPLSDSERYQTVFSMPGAGKSTAAPTAGLHLSQNLLEKIKVGGTSVAELELCVGLATFLPIKSKNISDHPMHSEQYEIPQKTFELCLEAREKGRRIIAVGTTVVRALESAAITNELRGSTQLFIRPGFKFQFIDALITNFHFPRSTLLVLLSAFIGDRWRGLYNHALQNNYRFLSFGDAMLVDRNTGKNI